MLLVPLLAVAAAPDFATRLWRALPAQTGNVVVSPTSVEACLGLLIPGVGPSSKAALAQTLGSSGPGLDGYANVLKARLAGLVQGGETTVSNAGFFSEAPKPTYVKAIQTLFGATAERLHSVEQVNGWVKAKTKGRIPTLLDRLPPNAHAVLVNAVTFDGDWTTAFDAGKTRKMAFHATSGTRDVYTMTSTSLHLAYAEGTGFRSVTLPYKGGHFEMTILLPTSGDPASILQGDAWRQIASTSRSIDLSLPRFTVRSTPNVEAALKTMGLAPLFKRIDLSLALPGGAHDAIDAVVQRTYVKVDEKGTAAAAATGIVTARAVMIRPDRVIFHVDRPFAFAIRSVGSGEVLFQGVIREL